MMRTGLHLKNYGNQRALSLGIRIVLVFLLALFIIIVAVYSALSQNFQTLLADYSIKLVQAMVEQGVTIVENELEAGRREISILADSFTAPPEGRPVEFSSIFLESDAVRILYVTKTGTESSDGRLLDVREREDIDAAFQGETAVYGPYFNEEDEYVICYSAPVKKNGEIVGVISQEKDGYLFCELIQNIRFIDSGESYIINAEGTDIAVSNLDHIEWVNTKYNGWRLLEEQEDPVTRSIVELEKKGLSGETGIGTYYWDDGLVYLVYSPIPSTGWVLLGGLREEEVSAMTQTVLISSALTGPAMIISFSVFLLLTALIVFWIISNTKKNAEINAKLELIANHDSLTGLLNRRFLETDLAKKWKYPIKVSGQAAIFMLDIDNFKKYNDYYGHPKGDDCLRQVAGVFQHVFDEVNGYVMRYGGEEFMAVMFLLDSQSALEKGWKVCRLVEQEKIPDSEGGFVTVSVGVSHTSRTLGISLYDCIQTADKALYQAKADGKNRAVLFEAERASSGESQKASSS